jgi:hypothetical protein
MSAAMVVIMIGRKRTKQALIDGLLRTLPLFPLSLDSTVDHHDGVLLHDAHQHDDPGVWYSEVPILEM